MGGVDVEAVSSSERESSGGGVVDVDFVPPNICTSSSAKGEDQSQSAHIRSRADVPRSKK